MLGSGCCWSWCRGVGVKDGAMTLAHDWFFGCSMFTVWPSLRATVFETLALEERKTNAGMENHPPYYEIEYIIVNSNG